MSLEADLLFFAHKIDRKHVIVLYLSLLMQVTIDIPEQFTQIFGADLSTAAKEALLLDAYRAGKVSLGFVAELLGLGTRLEAQKWLADHRVPLNYDMAELEADRQTLREHFHVEL
jgi:predicted HTH domain antitoxin